MAANNLDDIHVSDGLNDRLQIIAAIGDMLGSVRPDELADDTLLHLGQLIYRTAREANELTEELWRRLHAAKVELGVYPAMNENADGTGTAERER